MSGMDALVYINDDLKTSSKRTKNSATIYEWYPWSYFNVLFGCLIMGFIAIFFSFRTTMFKEEDNQRQARLWSYITLLWNILGTTAGISLALYAVFKE
jgi:hypothetical protein